MFNTTLIAPRAPDIHIHNEMVDPSIEKGARFLDETQEKARKRIIEAFAVEVPGIGVQLVRYDAEHLFMTDHIHQRAVFTINGRQFDVVVRDGEPGDVHGLVAALSEAIARSVVERIVTSAEPFRRLRSIK